MTIGFPSELAWLGVIIGMEWPEGDEDSLRRIATAWNDAASSIEDLAPELQAAAQSVQLNLDGTTADALSEVFQQLLNGDLSPEKMAEAATAAADMSDASATNIEYTKISFYVTLALTAAQIAWAIAMAVPTLGASLAEIGIAELIAQVAVREGLRLLIQKITSEVSKRVLLRAVQAAVTNAALAGLQDAAIQGYQIAAGGRKEFDSGQFSKTLVTSAIGGAAGGLAGGLAEKGIGKLAGRQIDDIAGQGTRWASRSVVGATDGVVNAAGAGAAGSLIYGDKFDPKTLVGGGLSGGLTAGPGKRPDAGDGPSSGDGNQPSPNGDGSTDAADTNPDAAGESAASPEGQPTPAPAPDANGGASPSDGSGDPNSGTQAGQHDSEAPSSSPEAPSEAPVADSPQSEQAPANNSSETSPQPAQTPEASPPQTPDSTPAPTSDVSTTEAGPEPSTSDTAPTTDSRPEGGQQHPNDGGQNRGDVPSDETPSPAGSDDASSAPSATPDGQPRNEPGATTPQSAGQTTSPGATTPQSAGQAAASPATQSTPNTSAPSATHSPVNADTSPSNASGTQQHATSSPDSRATDSGPGKNQTAADRPSPRTDGGARPDGAQHRPDATSPRTETAARRPAGFESSSRPVEHSPGRPAPERAPGHSDRAAAEHSSPKAPEEASAPHRPASVEDESVGPSHRTPQETDSASDNATDTSRRDQSDGPTRPDESTGKNESDSPKGDDVDSGVERSSTDHSSDGEKSDSAVPVHDRAEPTGDRADSSAASRRIDDRSDENDKVSGLGDESALLLTYPDGARTASAGFRDNVTQTRARLDAERAARGTHDGANDHGKSQAYENTGDAGDGGSPPNGPDSTGSGGKSPRPDVPALLEEAASRNGFQPLEVRDLLHRIAETGAGRDHLERMGDAEIDVLMGMRDAVPPPTLATDPVRKVVSGPQLDAIVNQVRHGTPFTPPFSPGSVGGCVSVVSDVSAVMRSSGQIVEGLRLDYHESPFTRPDAGDHVFVIDGLLDPETSELNTLDQHLIDEHNRRSGPPMVVDPLSSSLQWGDPPHTGVGFPGSERVLTPEYQAAGGSRFVDGAEFKRVNADGTSETVARLENGEWTAVSPDPNLDSGGLGAQSQSHDTSSSDSGLPSVHERDADPSEPLGDADLGEPDIQSSTRATDYTDDPANNCGSDSLSALGDHFGRPIDSMDGEPSGPEGMSGRDLEARGGGELRPTDPSALRERLLELGDGSAAVVVSEHSPISTSPDGQPRPVGAHAYTAINRDGEVVLVDGPPHARTEMPLPDDFGHRSWAMSFDPDGNPVHPINHDPATLGRDRLPGERGPDSRIGARSRDDASESDGQGPPDGSRPRDDGEPPGQKSKPEEPDTHSVPFNLLDEHDATRPAAVDDASTTGRPEPEQDSTQRPGADDRAADDSTGQPSRDEAETDSNDAGEPVPGGDRNGPDNTGEYKHPVDKAAERTAQARAELEEAQRSGDPKREEQAQQNLDRAERIEEQTRNVNDPGYRDKNYYEYRESTGDWRVRSGRDDPDAPRMWRDDHGNFYLDSDMPYVRSHYIEGSREPFAATDAEREAAQPMIDQRDQTIEDRNEAEAARNDPENDDAGIGADYPALHNEVGRLGEFLGDVAADHAMVNKYGGDGSTVERLNPDGSWEPVTSESVLSRLANDVDGFTPQGSGSFDAVYRITSPDGDVTVEIVEAKAPGGSLSSRVEDGVRYEQGTRGYMDPMLRRDKSITPDVDAVIQDADEILYSSVYAVVDQNGFGGSIRREFDLG
ncbi:hypothetical protein AAFP35_17465 [Gordonia sp. CPCC 206044]|uniref:WXG100-like domain-containing protein n=1 Tax=Gordonia sp. CPCC 206044 TaxID=3140793 RepID=UPI003AF3F6D9